MQEKGPENVDLEHFQQFTQRQAAKANDEPVSTCPLCEGRGFSRVTVDGYEFVKPCQCHRERKLAEALELAGIPHKFRRATLNAKTSGDRIALKSWGGGKSDPVALASQKNAIIMLRELGDTYLDFFLKNKKTKDPFGLMLYGDCGRGKTHMVCALLADLIHAGLTNVRFIEYNELFKQIRFSFDNKTISYKGIFDQLTRTQVLVIDDFGMEVSGNLVWVLDNIGYIINERYVANLPTILTSNYWRPIREEGGAKPQVEPSNPYETHNSWEAGRAHRARDEAERQQDEDDAYWDRISYRLRSRISEMCFELKLEGYDYRKKLAKTRELGLQIARQKQRS